MKIDRNPVKRLGSRVVHEGRLLRLQVDEVELPRGTRTQYEKATVKDGACTLAMEEDGTVWLVREWKYAVDRPSLEVVCGGIEEGEQPIEAARRELREEAGLEAAEWVQLGLVDPFTTMVKCEHFLYLAKGLKQVEREPEEAELLELVRVPFEEAVERVMRGEIRQAASCILILMAAEYLRRQV